MLFPKRTVITLVVLLLLAISTPTFAVESGQFRLLSVSDSVKLILVSQIPNKTKYLLDAGTAKITVDGKPAEIQSLDFYTIINVKFERRKSAKDGIEIDGVATEIKIVTQENKK